jgi:hypothetical protein
MLGDGPGFPTQFASIFFSDNPCILFNKQHLHALSNFFLRNCIKIPNFVHKVLKNHTLFSPHFVPCWFDEYLFVVIQKNKTKLDNITKFSMRLLILTFNAIGEGVLVAFLHLFVSRFVLRLVVRIKLFLTCVKILKTSLILPMELNTSQFNGHLTCQPLLNP